MKLRVFVSGSWDMLHSGHVTFLKKASEYGELFVGVGSDASITKYKGKPPVCNEEERLFMLRSLKYVSEAWVNTKEGPVDFIEDLRYTNPDIFICNEEQHSEAKESLCYDLGIKYIVLKRDTLPGLPERSTTKYREICN